MAPSPFASLVCADICDSEVVLEQTLLSLWGKPSQVTKWCLAAVGCAGWSRLALGMPARATALGDPGERAGELQEEPWNGEEEVGKQG